MKAYRDFALREVPAPPPTEQEMQALWFEQLIERRLPTDDGRRVEIVQPGFWNHGPGPDFQRVALRFLDAQDRPGPVVVGDAEAHLHALDWNTHGHHADPAYDGTILHLVWHRRTGGPAFFPATSAYRRVPQVYLSEHLPAPWEELRPLVVRPPGEQLPAAVPGRCAPVLAAMPVARVTEIVRAAGRYRLRQRARRWHWWQRLQGREQALFEGLAEALGFHANQVPMRLVAQRLPWRRLRALDPNARLAHLFGLAGFLPDKSAARLRREPRAWVRELWETWWKARAELDYALLPRSQWRLAGLRPLNRPERRLAALAQLVPQLPRLLEALADRDEARFAAGLLAVRDPFWESHATLGGTPLAAPCRLLGEERVGDILINVFWPLVAVEDQALAENGLAALRSSGTGATRIATQRTLLQALPGKIMREALVQQGLLQIYRDYCQADCSNCAACTFPEFVQAWT